MRAARKMMVPHPASFQMDWMVTRNGKNSGVVMASKRGRPRLSSRCGTAPVAPRTSEKTATMITQPMKCGR
ncbi:hypothetical protein D3C76_1803870 [compost metagenome]